MEEENEDTKHKAKRDPPLLESKQLEVLNNIKKLLNDTHELLKVKPIEEADSMMQNACEGLFELIPPYVRSQLPWGAIINLIDQGFKKVGWSFGGKVESTQGFGTNDYVEALRLACHGILRWLPQEGEVSQATLTEVPSEVPEENLAQLQEEYVVRYPEEHILRVIPDDFPQRIYRKQQGPKDKGLHWGQRKLFFNELELLTMHAEAGDTVLYAGAAPGTHIDFLAKEMFPEVYFVLIDPANFSISETKYIKIINSLMDDDLANKYKETPNVLFISDIRRTYCSEDLIKEDMSDQQRWYEILGAKVGMFKFRLPWFDGTTEYMDGDVYTQPYCPPHSTETRLIVQGNKRKVWDHVKYERQCYYFNTIVRKTPHCHGVQGAGLEDTYDHAVEVEILRSYLLKYDPEFSTKGLEDQKEAIARWSVRITEAIGGRQAKDWLQYVDSKYRSRRRRQEEDWYEDSTPGRKRGSWTDRGESRTDRSYRHKYS